MRNELLKRARRLERDKGFQNWLKQHNSAFIKDVEYIFNEIRKTKKRDFMYKIYLIFLRRLLELDFKKAYDLSFDDGEYDKLHSWIEMYTNNYDILTEYDRSKIQEYKSLVHKYITVFETTLCNPFEFAFGYNLDNETEYNGNKLRLEMEFMLLKKRWIVMDFDDLTEILGLEKRKSLDNAPTKRFIKIEEIKDCKEHKNQEGNFEMSVSLGIKKQNDTLIARNLRKRMIENGK